MYKNFSQSLRAFQSVVIDFSSVPEPISCTQWRTTMLLLCSPCVVWQGGFQGQCGFSSTLQAGEEALGWPNGPWTVVWIWTMDTRGWWQVSDGLSDTYSIERSTRNALCQTPPVTCVEKVELVLVVRFLYLSTKKLSIIFNCDAWTGTSIFLVSYGFGTWGLAILVSDITNQSPSD